MAIVYLLQELYFRNGEGVLKVIKSFQRRTKIFE